MILIYNMFLLQLPSKTTNEENKILKSSFWGDHPDKNNVLAIKWKEILKPMEEGGLGIRDMY